MTQPTQQPGSGAAMSKPTPNTPELQAFYHAHPSFDVLRCDFTGRQPLDERLASVDASTVEQLKAGQRLLRLTRDDKAAQTLYACGYASAWQVASKSAAMFLRDVEDRLPEDIARPLHRRARSIKARTLHLWATVHNLVASPHFRQSRINNIPAEITQYLSAIPDYEDLFGSLDYYEVAHCQSILSPAAYFVELMWYVDQYLDGPNADKIPTGFRLDARRPDLKQIELTCANTLNTEPFLNIVNDVLRAQVASHVSPQSPDAYLAAQNYPWALPLELPWEQTQGDLAYMQADLFKIYRTFDGAANNHQDLIGRAETGLSVDVAALITTPACDTDNSNDATEDNSQLAALYGLDAGADLPTVLANRDTFLQHAWMTRLELVALLRQALNSTEWHAGLGHRLYINQVLADGKAVDLIPVADATDETLSPLTNAVLDRLHRLARLQGVLHWTFTALDTALRALGIDASNDINAATLNALGRLNVLQQQYRLPADVLCALFADMNTLGIGDPDQPTALFDRIYNLPQRLGAETIYHPSYDGNVLYTDTPVTWNENGATSDESRFSSTRLASSLGLKQSDLNALREALWSGQTPTLNVVNLTELYRNTLLMQQLGYSLTDYNILLYLLGITPTATDLVAPLQLGSDPMACLTQFEALLDTAAWLNHQSWTVQYPDYILYGCEHPGVDILIPSASAPTRMAAWWTQPMPPVPADVSTLTPEQTAQLQEGVALYFGIDTALFPGLAHWVTALTGVDNYLYLLYTPNPFPAQYWRLDDGDGSTLTNEISDLDGVLQGDPTWENATDFPGGVARPALHLNGADNAIDLGQTVDELGLSDSSFTMQAWIKLDALPDTPDLYAPILAADADNDQALHWVVRSDGRVVIGFGDNELCSNAPLQTAEWTHLTCRYDQDKQAQTLFINGAPDHSAGSDGALQSSTDPVRIGAWTHGATTEFFGGYIAEVRLWRTARSTTQIQRDYDAYVHADASTISDWQQIQRFLTYLSRYRLLATDANLSGRQFDSMAAYPSQYNLPALNDAPVTPVPLDFPQLRTVIDFRALVDGVGDSQKEQLITYLENVADGVLADANAKIDALAPLMGWLTSELQALITADPSIGYTAADLDTAAGLLRLNSAFTLMQTMGANVMLIKQLIALGGASATDAANQATANAVRHLVESQYQGEALSDVLRQLDDPLNERQRNAMTPWVIWTLNNQWADSPEYQLNSIQDLSEYLLLDVQMEGASDSTPIKQAQLSLQMYIQRCQIGIETGVKPAPVNNQQWTWLLSYRLWEANRKIFLYPENYIRPELRTDQSDQFSQLANALQQGQLDEARVETAFRDYLNGFESLARLQIVETARYRVESTGLPIDTLFVFGRTATEPPTYYYRRCTDAGLPQPVWDYWEKIEVQINALTVMPAYAFSRLFLFWAEHKEITKDKDTGAEIQITVRYSFLNAHNQWIAPQTLIADYQPEGVAYGDLKSNLFWQRPYALVTPLDDPDDEAGEQILVSLGEILNATGHLNDTGGASDAGSTNANPHTWRLTAELLPEQTSLTLLSVNPTSWGQEAISSPLTKGRQNPVATTINTPDGDFALFAGGYGFDEEGLDEESSQVDIYQYKDGDWRHFSSAVGHVPKLSESRDNLAATKISTPEGDFALFAGGFGEKNSPQVDIYQYKNGQWLHLSSAAGDVHSLSEGRNALAATTINTPDGDFALFAGGYNGSKASNTVDIYQYKDGQWNHFSSIGDDIPSLAAGRFGLAATTINTPDGDFALFAGGFENTNTTTVDIYQYLDGQWNHFSSTAGDVPNLSEARTRLVATTISTPDGDFALFAGGDNNASTSYLAAVDVYQYLDGQWNHASSTDSQIPGLPEARALLAATTISTPDGDFALFAGGYSKDLESKTVDIYRHKNGQWDIFSSSDDDQVPTISQARGYLAATTINTPDGDFAIFAGGHSDHGYASMVDSYYYHCSQVKDQFIAEGALKAALAQNRLADNYHNDYTSSATAGIPSDAQTLLNNLPATGIATCSVKNQAGWSVLAYGRRAFLSQPQPADPDKSTTIKGTALVTGATDAVSASSDSYAGDANVKQSFLFTRLTTGVVQRFMQRLFSGGLDHLLSLDSQRTPEFDLHRFGPTESAVVPTADHLDFSGAYGAYYWEIFYHAPTLVAAALATQQQFSDAKHWYEYIFSPTSQDDMGLDAGNEAQRVWQFLPFRNHTLQTLDDILANEQQLRVSMEQPFDPHALARLRIGAYEKTVVMRYIDTLLDWGDSYFAQDSWEAINRATTLYFLALDILGPKPRRLGDAPLPTDYPKTYADLAQALTAAPSPAIAHLEQMAATAITDSSLPQADGIFPLEHITDYFGVNENQEFIGYWDRVEDRLYKIRNGLNLEGVARPLALFQPPVDPNQLVQAAAAGGSGAISFASTGVAPHYRFDAILARARNVTANLIQLGASLLAALEKRDAEALAQLQSGQHTQLLQLMTTTKTQQIDEAQANRAALQRGLEAAQYRQQYYQGLLTAGLSAGEISNLTLLAAAQMPLVIASTTYGLAIAGYLTPDTFGLADGGMDFGKSIEAVAGINNSLAATFNQGANIAATTAGYDRRRQDWAAQAGIAQRDAAQIEQQITAMDAAVEIAQSELDTHCKSIAQANEIETFYRTKYTNQDLYQWMSGQLSAAYYQCYQIALALGSQAERAYQYELSRSDTYLRTNYWDSLHQGLTAGEQLMWGLDQLEKAYLDNNTRTLEVERTISLQQYAPEALGALKQHGLCNFSLSEQLFDQDYPGQYCRQIKTLSLSIPALIGPYQNIKATLTQTANKVLMQPDIAGVQYLLGEQVKEQPDTSVLRQDWRPTQHIALSSGLNDSGQFMLNFQDERYLPFEGTGAVSDWTLEMAKAANPVDFNSITDVIIQLRYTAQYDEGLRNKTIALDKIKQYQGTLYLGLRQFAPSAWATFMQDDTLPADLDFTLTEALLPPNVSQPELTGATVQALFKEGQSGSPTWTLNGGTPIEGDGAFDAPPQFGSNTLSLTQNVTPNELQDVILIVPFTGTLDWGSP